MTHAIRYFLLGLALAGFAASVTAQPKTDKKSGGSFQCRDSNSDDRLISHCEIKEQTVSAGGLVTVDGKQNGGISIKGWERNEVLVRAKIETRAPTQAEAESLAQQVRIETGALNIHAEGPESKNDYKRYVRYEIYMQ